MTKQAILITAYTNVNSLKEIIIFFNKNYEIYFNFYIHVDSKSNIQLQDLNEFKNVFVWKKYKIFWGGFNHLKAILFLCEQALYNNNNQYFHLITCQDFPSQKIEEFLKIDVKKNYLQYFEVPRTDGGWKDENHGLDRVKYYQLFNLFDCRNGKKKKLNKKFVLLQKRLNFSRKFSGIPLWGGSTYWSLSRSVLQYIIDYTNNNGYFLNHFKHTFCPEELYFQTIILNSEHNNKSLVNNNKRYIDWNSGKGGYPAFLDISDLQNIILSNSFFCRKIHFSENELKRKIKQYTHENIY